MKVIFKAKAMQFKNGCLLLPATPADRRILDPFCQSAANHIITVTANYSRSNKTYDQVKTVFALVEIIFTCNFDRKPNQEECERLYKELLELYAERRECLLDVNKTEPVPLSKMTKHQASEFINALIHLIMKNCDLTESQSVDVKQIFEEFQQNEGFGEKNPIDYDESGELLSESEWREKNRYSFASGLIDETLQLHHIISKGARPDIKDCAWNWIMLTDYEHNRIYHDKGWETFLEMFPHCANRIKNAFDKGHQLYPLDLQDALKKLGLIQENGLDVEKKQEENTDIIEEKKEFNTASLATFALDDTLDDDVPLF